MSVGAEETIEIKPGKSKRFPLLVSLLLTRLIVEIEHVH